MQKYEPTVGKIYSFTQIVSELILSDTPSLNYAYEGKNLVIQTAHCTYEKMLALPQWAESKWQYKYTTSEWVPVFQYVHSGTINFDQLVDVETDINNGGDWVTPKGLPREQYKY